MTTIKQPQRQATLKKTAADKAVAGKAVADSDRSAVVFPFQAIHQGVEMSTLSHLNRYRNLSINTITPVLNLTLLRIPTLNLTLLLTLMATVIATPETCSIRKSRSRQGSCRQGSYRQGSNGTRKSSCRQGNGRPWMLKRWGEVASRTVKKRSGGSNFGTPYHRSGWQGQSGSWYTIDSYLAIICYAHRHFNPRVCQ